MDYAPAVRVVVLSSTRWDSPWLSKQHLAAAWRRRGDSVLYVDPPVSVLSLLRQPDRARELLSRSDRQDGGVDVWTPRVVPGQNRSVPQRLNAGRIVRGARRRLPRADATVAFGLEARRALAGSTGVRVYHCTDSWVDHPAADPAVARRWEDEITRVADLVVACSRPLVEMLAERGVEASYLPHGVEIDAFDEARPDPAIAALPGPVIGYAGGLNFRLAPELLEAALASVPGGTLALIGSAWRSARGSMDTRVSALVERPDVVAVGHRSGRDLAASLAALDVSLVPYRDTAFNRRSFPLKVPQYLAAGLPVVSTANGATDEYGDHVQVATGAEDFGDAVARAASRGIDGAASRRAAARRRPWSVVAEELVRLAGLAESSPQRRDH